MRMVQFVTPDGHRRVAEVLSPDSLSVLSGVISMRDLALRAADAGGGLEDLVARAPRSGEVDYETVVREARLLAPLDHPDPAHLLVTGTGLTHLGSADARDAMHRKVAAEGEQSLTDSMRMFRMGLEGGRPPEGRLGVQPEWFYKGDGDIVVAPEQAIPSPDFAEDAGEEAELMGLYVIAADGRPWRVGHALANEFSDHVMERRNYLYLAHSKLRYCSFGPELLLGEPPADIRGVSRIVRDGEVLWEKPFATGEANMCHSLANLEGHHFKYRQFRRPGDVHCHFLGAITISFSDGIRTRDGDRFEIGAAEFGRPLRNALHIRAEPPCPVRAL